MAKRNNKYIFLTAFLILFGYLLILGCSKESDKLKNNKSGSDNADVNDDTVKFTLIDFLTENAVLQRRTEKAFNKLSESEKVAQMIITSAGNYGKPNDVVLRLVREKKVGGVVFLGGSKESFSNFIKLINNIADSLSSPGLIISTDAEPSLINNKIKGLPPFPPTNTLTTVEKSRESARDISSILNAMGFNQNYAPVCDLAINKEIIGNRSYGNNIEEAKLLAAAFADETQSNFNIIATSKHFPGHGNVKGDSHKELVYIDGELEELEMFRHLINNGVLSIMIGHIAVKNNNTYNTDGYPSTLSKKIVTGLLKDELKFKGLVVTDAMNMGALSKFDLPALNAAIAGCDMILMPTNEEMLLNNILNKMNNDEGFKNQIYESVKKILKAKICLGIVKP